MPKVEQWARAAEKLIQLTEDGKLNWITNRFPAILREDILGETIYSASVQGRWIAVYEYRYKDFSDSEEFSWCNDIAIEFVDFNGGLEWRWPTVHNRVQLLDAIRAKVCGANDFLKQFLEDT
jgi:hypothetical protein